MGTSGESRVLYGMPGRVFTEILALAAEQNGFVRTREVRELGIDPRRLNDYARRGLAERVGRGLYRIELVPPGDFDEFARAAQWPDGRGTLSGETALDLHELCDVSPAHIDITVPRGYRTHRPVPARYRLHPRDIAEDEVTWLRASRSSRPRARSPTASSSACAPRLSTWPSTPRRGRR